MNLQRIVAAVAAVAIGFGVTLVGVAVGDDAESVTSIDPEVLGAESDDGPTDQPDADVDEAGDPEVESGGAESPVEPPSRQSESGGAAESTSGRCDDLAADGATDDELSAAGCNSDDSRREEETGTEVCLEIVEVVASDGRVLVLTEGFGTDQSGDVFLADGSVPIDALGFVDEVNLRLAFHDEIHGVFVACDDGEELVEVDRDSLLRQIDAADDTPGAGDATGGQSRPVGSAQQVGDDVASLCGVTFDELPSFVTDDHEEFQPGGGIGASVESASVSDEFDEYIEFMGALLDLRSFDAPSPGWTENLRSITLADSFADVDCADFDDRLDDLEREFQGIESQDQYSRAVGSTICLFGHFSVRDVAGEQPSSSIFTFLDRTGSVGRCQIDPALTMTKGEN